MLSGSAPERWSWRGSCLWRSTPLTYPRRQSLTCSSPMAWSVVAGNVVDAKHVILVRSRDHRALECFVCAWRVRQAGGQEWHSNASGCYFLFQPCDLDTSSRFTGASTRRAALRTSRVLQHHALHAPRRPARRGTPCSSRPRAMSIRCTGNASSLSARIAHWPAPSCAALWRVRVGLANSARHPPSPPPAPKSARRLSACEQRTCGARVDVPRQRQHTRGVFIPAVRQCALARDDPAPGVRFTASL